MIPLKEVLFDRFGQDFPVGAGTAKREDPLIITELSDYVSVEYAVATFLLSAMGLTYQFERQYVHNHDDKVVDELVYATRAADDSEWTETRRFFFDITAGFRASRSASNSEGPQEPAPNPGSECPHCRATIIRLRSGTICCPTCARQWSAVSNSGPESEVTAIGGRRVDHRDKLDELVAAVGRELSPEFVRESAEIEAFVDAVTKSRTRQLRASHVAWFAGTLALLGLWISAIVSWRWATPALVVWILLWPVLSRLWIDAITRRRIQRGTIRIMENNRVHALT